MVLVVLLKGRLSVNVGSSRGAGQIAMVPCPLLWPAWICRVVERMLLQTKWRRGCWRHYLQGLRFIYCLFLVTLGIVKGQHWVIWQLAQWHGGHLHGRHHQEVGDSWRRAEGVIQASCS